MDRMVGQKKAVEDELLPRDYSVGEAHRGFQDFVPPCERKNKSLAKDMNSQYGEG